MVMLGRRRILGWLKVKGGICLDSDEVIIRIYNYITCIIIRSATEIVGEGTGPSQTDKKGDRMTVETRYPNRGGASEYNFLCVRPGTIPECIRPIVKIECYCVDVRSYPFDLTSCPIILVLRCI